MQGQLGRFCVGRKRNRREWFKKIWEKIGRFCGGRKRKKGRGLKNVGKKGDFWDDDKEKEESGLKKMQGK